MRNALSALLCAAALSACGGTDDNPDASNGRAETQSIRATEAVGYSGDAIADKVNAALDANDQRKDELDREIDAQSQ